MHTRLRLGFESLNDWQEYSLHRFGGTWCGDTKRELPKFFKIMALAKIPAENIELYGVDRSKESGDGIREKYNIVSVPTFILISGGKEIGRIVEYPKNSLELDMVDLLRKQ